MTCKEIKYYVNDYADGFLINEIRREIANHLDNCIDCKNHYLNVISILKETSSLPKNITMTRDIRKLISEKPRGNKKASLKVLSINQLDNYLNAESRKKTFTLKKEYKKSGWFFVSAVVIAIVLGITLGILYYSQYLNN
jgi:hypothetical protein